MTVRFVLAPAGAGKTTFCIRQLAAEIGRKPLGPPLLFLLPEQATFIHERQLAASCVGGGFCRAEVSGFRRLVYRAYQREGIEPLTPLSEGGKLMLGAAVTAACRDQLRVLAPAAGKRGFAGQVMAAGEELATYGISPDELDRAVEKLAARDPTNHSVAKLREIGVLYRAYRQDHDGTYGSYRENMEFLAQAIGSGFLGDTQVWIDGYNQFTPSERQVVGAMLAACPQVTITLPLDAAQAEQVVSMESPFYPAWREYAALTELARQQGTAVDPPVLLDGSRGRFAQNPDLAAAHAWLTGPAPTPRPEAPAGLRLWAATDRRQELSRVAREILRLCREEGLRFRDVGIFARDLEPYQTLLPAVFDEMGVPYFIDAKKPLLYHPLLELVRSVMEVWTYRPEPRRLLRFLKNRLHPMWGETGDRMENYLLRHGLRFWHWQHPDKPLPQPEPEEGLTPEQVEAWRRQGIEPLLALCRELGGGCSAPAFNQRLYRLLAELGVEDRLTDLTQQALDRGDGEQAEWHRQAWNRLSELLQESEGLLGDAVYPAAELTDLYEAAFSGLTISTIPPGVDQVTIGSLERTYHPELQAAFLLSLNEGVLPRRVSESGLFHDGERRLLAQVQVQLAPDSAERQCGENALLYQGLSRCGHRLYLSYLMHGDDGGELAPSPVIGDLRRVFPTLEPEGCQVDQASLLVGGPADLALCSAQLSRDRSVPLWQAVYRYYQGQETQADLVRQVERGLTYGPSTRRLSRAALQRWYGGRLYGSVTRLEQYRRCPFAYFATYGLKTKPRPEYQLSAPDRGTLVHQALAAIGRLVNEQGLDWATLDRETIQAMVDQVLDQLLPGFLSGILDSSPRYAYLQTRLRRTLVYATLLLVEQVRRSGFLPIAFELPFGGKGSGLPAFTIPVDPDRDLVLTGQIDRVDAARSGDRTWLRVVDYKTGKPTLDRRDMLAGLQVQLVLYLQVVMAHGGLLSGGGPVSPGGAYYAYVRDDLRSGQEEGEIPDLKLAGLTVLDQTGVELADSELATLAQEERAGTSQLIPVSFDKTGQVKASGSCIPPERLEQLTAALTATLRDTARAMLDGEIPVWPLLDGKHDTCAQCSQRAVCGFDRTLAPSRTLQDLLGKEAER